jgi:hypothetical protein
MEFLKSKYDKELNSEGLVVIVGSKFDRSRTVEQAMHGGASDCRNRTMQQMFLMIGLGERACSGLPKIIHGWQDTGHFLQLSDSFEPYDHSVLEMH